MAEYCNLHIGKKADKDNQNYNVFYWEAILLEEIKHFEKKIDGKLKYLESLKDTPFNKLDSSKIKHLNLLESEIRQLVGIFSIIENLKNAYVFTTASIADYHRSIINANELLKSELKKLKIEYQLIFNSYKIALQHIDGLQLETQMWMELYISKGKEVDNA